MYCLNTIKLGEQVKKRLKVKEEGEEHIVSVITIAADKGQSLDKTKMMEGLLAFFGLSINNTL